MIDRGKLKVIDLSVPLKKLPNQPMSVEIEYIDHRGGAEAAREMFDIDPSELRDEKFASWEQVTATTHSGTHLDSPYHFWDTSEGKPSKRIDQIPLEWCYADGVVLDFTHKAKGDAVTSQDIQNVLQKIGYTLKPYDIVLIRTDTTRHYEEQGYDMMHCGVTAEATRWLIDQGVKITGIDAWGWDRPFDLMVEDFKSGKKDQLWEGHWVGRDKEYLHIENMANLDKISQPFGFKVAVFPIKIHQASGAWVRAVAILEE